MSSKARLAKLEQYRPNIKYPSFSDMYSTQTKETYIPWMLTNNPLATRQTILDMNIKSLVGMYE